MKYYTSVWECGPRRYSEFVLQNAGTHVKRSVLYCLTIVVATLITGCATTTGNTPSEKREAVQDMRRSVLANLYELKPSTRNQIQAAPGYAVFSNANVNLILASFGGGYGIVRDNKSGRDVYMKMGEVGIGLGLGIKDFRAVFVFHDRATLDRFIRSGWEFGAHADAAAKASDRGAAVGGEIVVDNITIYQITKSGLALQATIKGTKYWQDSNLN